MFKKIKRYIKDPYIALADDLILKHPELMSDKFYLSTLWRRVMGYKIDWKNPRTFNEKLQWLKLYDHNPLYTTIVDKRLVKQWVANKIGWDYIIPTLAVYMSVEDIKLDTLPDQFVLKCNHDSGGVVICRDKSSFDLEAAKKTLESRIRHNYYMDFREWPYKHVKRCIIAEPYLEDSSSHDQPDYKFFAFDGRVKALYIATERNNAESETCFDFFDMCFNHIDVTNGHPNAISLPEKPKHFNEMIKIAEILSQGFPHVRCDLYEIDGKVYFGEMTFYHMGGIVKFNPATYDELLGAFISLPRR